MLWQMFLRASLILLQALSATRAFPASGFNEDYLSSGFWRMSGAKTSPNLGEGLKPAPMSEIPRKSEARNRFWPDSKYLFWQRKGPRSTASPPAAPAVHQKGSEPGDDAEWEVFDGTTVSSSSSGTAPTPPPPSPLSEPPTVGPTFSSSTSRPSTTTSRLFQSSTTASASMGLPPKFLMNAPEAARASYSRVGLNTVMTKRQLRAAYDAWALAQTPSIRDAFYRQRDERDAHVANLRAAMMTRANLTLSGDALKVFREIQAIHDNEDLTVAEDQAMVNAVMRGTSDSARTKLIRLKR